MKSISDKIAICLVLLSTVVAHRLAWAAPDFSCQAKADQLSAKFELKNSSEATVSLKKAGGKTFSCPVRITSIGDYRGGPLQNIDLRFTHGGGCSPDLPTEVGSNLRPHSLLRIDFRSKTTQAALLFIKRQGLIACQNLQIDLKKFDATILRPPSPARVLASPSKGK